MGGGAPEAGGEPRAGDEVRDGGLGEAEAVTGVPGRESGKGTLEGVLDRTSDAERRFTARGGIGGAGVAGDDVT
jgi:hypothetical protein